jgi:hypothetical protein
MGLWNYDPIRSLDLDGQMYGPSRLAYKLHRHRNGTKPWPPLALVSFFPEDVLHMNMNSDTRFGLGSVLAGSLVSTL